MTSLSRTAVFQALPTPDPPGRRAMSIANLTDEQVSSPSPTPSGSPGLSGTLAFRPPQSPPVVPIYQDPWEVHKSLLHRLYIDEGKRLKDVMEKMEREHNFFASSNMYKKKFRQWKFQTNRKGWRVRGAGRTAQTPAMSTAVTVHEVVNQIRPPRPLELPTNLRIHEASVKAIWDHLCRGLKPLIPPGRQPLTSPHAPYVERLPLPTPFLLIDFQSCCFTQTELAKKRAPGSPVEPYFGKAFRKVEGVIRTDYVFSSMNILEALASTGNAGETDLRFLLLKELYMTALRVHGRDHVVTVWTNWLLHAPNPLRTELVELLAKVFTEALGSVMGKYDYATLSNRLRELKIKSSNPEFHQHAEWDQLIRDCEQSPHNCNTLVWNARGYYADFLEQKGDLAQAEIVLQDFPVLINSVRAGELSHNDNWSLVGGVDAYASTLAGQNKDALAESAYQLALSKGRELLGEENPMTAECKKHYQEFLGSKGRIQELDQFEAEKDISEQQWTLDGTGTG